VGLVSADRRVASVLGALGLAALLLSVWLSLPAFAVGLGGRSIAAGGGDYFVGLFGGVPALAAALLLLGAGTLQASWRTRVSSVGLVLALVHALLWVVVIVRHP
jgi:hypothetical protein